MEIVDLLKHKTTSACGIQFEDGTIRYRVVFSDNPFIHRTDYKESREINPNQARKLLKKLLRYSPDNDTKVRVKDIIINIINQKYLN